MTGTRSKRTPMRNRHAFSLAETLFSVVLVGTLLVAALYTAGDAIHFRSTSADSLRAELLCHDLLAEILEKPYEDPDASPAFGLESGETVPRTNFDDVDDFHGWNAAPPQARDGTELPDLSGWQRSVTVTFARSDAPDEPAGTDSGLKRIKVAIDINGIPAAACFAIRTRAADEARQ